MSVKSLRGFDWGRLRRDVARIIFGPWPLRPALTFTVLFIINIYAANNALDVRRQTLRESWMASLPIASSVALTAAIVVLIGRQLRLARPHGTGRANYIVTMLAGGTALGITSFVARSTFDAASIEWRNWSFFAGRGIIALALIHAVAGISDARLLAQIERTEEALRALAEQRRIIVDAEERARGAVARFLHDNVQAGLVAISLQLRAIRERAPSPVDDELGSIVEALEEMRSVDVRLAGRRLSPDFAIIGLQQALSECMSQYVKSMSVDIHIDDALTEWSHPTERGHRQSLAVYRITEQAVLNAAVHGQARHVSIDITRDGDTVILAVRDEGLGIPPGREPVLGSGLTIIDAWSEILEGEWTLAPRVDGGAVLTVRFPIARAPISSE